MNLSRPSCALFSVILIAAGLVFSPPTPANAVTMCSGTTNQDFDDDGHADIVVSRTMPGTRAGVVDIVMSGGTTQTISAATLGYPSAANDQFGAAVTIADMDDIDNCADLIIGAPGTAGGGAVYLVRGTGSGVATSAVRLTSPVAGARFGTTVGATDLSLTRVKLLIGAPGLNVGSATSAGGIVVWQLTKGVPSGSSVTLTYSTFGGTPAANDHLGSVMDVTGWHATLGVPDRDIGSAKDAGEVITFSFLDEFGPIQINDWARANQNSPKAPDVAETGDHFGASVDFSGVFAFVGVPGEDVGGHKDTGLVMRYAPVYGTHTLTNWKSWSQNSSGVPGSNETGDHFGASVHIGWIELLADGDPYSAQIYVVGAPGEDIGKVKDAGAITVLAPGVKPAFSLRQGAGLPGKAEKGDQVGAALGDFPGEYHGPYYDGDGILVGAPGEDVGTTVDSGLMMSARGLLPKGKFTWHSSTNLGPAVAGAKYGWTLPQAS